MRTGAAGPGRAGPPGQRLPPLCSTGPCPARLYPARLYPAGTGPEQGDAAEAGSPQRELAPGQPEPRPPGGAQGRGAAEWGRGGERLAWGRAP